MRSGASGGGWAWSRAVALAAGLAAGLGAPTLRAAGDSAQDASVAALVRAHLDARGGRQRLAAVTSLSARGRLRSSAVETAFRLDWVRPDKARLELKGTRTMIEVVTGPLAWWVAPDTEPPQSALLPPDAAREIAERADPEGILGHLGERGYTATLGGETWVGGERAVTIRLARGEDELHRVDLSVRSHLVLRRTSRWGRQGVAAEIEALFSDYRTVAGVAVPFAIERRVGGELLHRIVVEHVELNPEIRPALFEPPADLVLPPPAR